MKKIYSSLFKLIAFTCVLNAQSFDPYLANELQSKIDSIRSVYNLKGISAAVYVPDQGVWQGVTGESHTGVPITAETGFGIASNTKLFTAVLILKLAESGLLSLDDSLHRFLPGFNHVDSSITIRQLLNHTSGLSDVNIAGYPDSMLADPNRIFYPEEIVSWVRPPLSAPGAGWYYCNTNYLLAGLIAEYAGGQRFHQLLRDSILTPLELDSTYLDVYESTGLISAHPWQGGMDFQSTPRTSINSAAWSAGGMYSTSGEMIQWYRALMNAEVINRASLGEMTNFVGSGNYGMGISEAVILGRNIWQHGGTIWGGYNSSMMYDPSSGTIICVLINQLPAQAYQLAIQLLSTVINNPVGHIDAAIPGSPVRIYPNPTEGPVCVEIPGQVIQSIKIYDIQAQLIAETTQSHMNVSKLPGGTFFIRVQTNEGSYGQKLIKQ